jgi:hypothetical protein
MLILSGSGAKRTPMADQPTLFMRIHKTAGMALAKQIRDRLPPNVVCPEQFEWRVRSLPSAGLRQFAFFEGHISPAALSGTFPDLRTFTVLRDPRERLLSCFFYWKEGAKHAKGEFFDAIAPLSLLHFLRSESPIIRRATWNVQARLLAGGQFGLVDGQRQNVFGPALCGSDLSVEAVRALDRFAFVGAAERYDRCLRMAYALLELAEPPPPERVNVTHARPASYGELLADPDIANAASALTEADQAVYDEVCRRLEVSG